MMERYIVKDAEYVCFDEPGGRETARFPLKAGTWEARIADHDVHGLRSMGIIGTDPKTGLWERAFVRQRPEGEEPGYTPPNERRRPREAVEAVKKHGQG